MLKKHIELIKLYNLESTSYVESDVNKFEGMILGILLFAGGILMEILGINDSIWMYLYLILMWLNVIFTERAVSKPVRVLPLKDSFIVSNVLFVLPLGYGVVMGIAASVFYGFIGCLISSIVDGEAFGDIIKYGLHTFRDGYDPLKLLYVLGIAVGIWFLMSVQAFYRDRSRRIAGYIVIGVLCVFYIVVAAIIMRQMGVHGNYYLSEVFDVLPRIPCAVAALVFAAASGIYSWKRCMLLYRGDSKGQERMKSPGKNNEERLESWRVLNSDTGKKGRIWAAAGAVMVLVVMGMIAWFLSSGTGLDESDSGKGEIHAESHDPAEYTEWNSYLEAAGVPEEAGFLYWDMEQIVFPESINKAYIKEYYARMEGDYSYKVYEAPDGMEDEEESPASGSWDVEAARLLVADYPKEEFLKEQGRIASLSYSERDYYSDDTILTNYMLVDKENFPGTAYIAQYDTAVDNYEYVIVDDKSCRIIYVYLSACRDIPTDAAYKAEKPSKVVPIDKRNSSRGYSIYELY